VLQFKFEAAQFWNYLEEHPLWSGVLAQYVATAPSHDGELASMKTHRGSVSVFATEREQQDFVFRVVEHCAKQSLDEQLGAWYQVGRAYGQASKHSENLDLFREHFLEPFYEVLDEALDEQAAVLSLLVKYKRKVEWFERKQVAEICLRGERALVQHLYAYLFDQGLDFYIEPQSISGEADLVAQELVLDAKVFDGLSSSRGVRYLKHGFNQVLTYARDFNQSVGYLVAYRTCEDDLQFDFATSNMLVPHLTCGGKVIFIMVVDLCDYQASASKRGGLKTFTVMEADLIEQQSTDAEELQAQRAAAQFIGSPVSPTPPPLP
jgi:hypothetical protein